MRKILKTFTVNEARTLSGQSVNSVANGIFVL